MYVTWQQEPCCAGRWGCQLWLLRIALLPFCTQLYHSNTGYVLAPLRPTMLQMNTLMVKQSVSDKILNSKQLQQYCVAAFLIAETANFAWMPHFFYWHDYTLHYLLYDSNKHNFFYLVRLVLYQRAAFSIPAQHTDTEGERKAIKSIIWDLSLWVRLSFPLYDCG